MPLPDTPGGRRLKAKDFISSGLSLWRRARFLPSADRRKSIGQYGHSVARAGGHEASGDLADIPAVGIGFRGVAARQRIPSPPLVVLSVVLMFLLAYVLHIRNV